MRIIRWHRDLTKRVQHRLGLSNYAIAWIAFGKGLFIGYLLGNL